MYRRHPQARFEIRPRATQIPINFNNNNNNNHRTAMGKMTFRRHLDQYLNQASLHGLRYIGDRTLTWFERIFFFCMLLIVLVLSGFFIQNMWIQWTEKTIVTMLPQRIPAITMPFPAVTICNANVMRKSVIQQMTPNSLAHKIAQGNCLRTDWPLLNLTATWPVYFDVINKISHPCAEMIAICKYGNVIVNCSRLFRPVNTEKGICCTFNAIPPRSFYKRLPQNLSYTYDADEESTWHIEKGFQHNMSENPYSFPRPFIGTGNKYGLRVLLNGNVTERFCSVDSNGGFVVQLHNSNEQPYPIRFGQYIKSGHETRMDIIPSIIQTESNVKKVPKLLRRCLFQDESPLEYFGTYSSINCLSEFYTKFIYNECNCTYITLPSIYTNAIICGEVHAKCIEHVEDVWGEYVESLRDICLDSCWSLSHRSTITNAPIRNNSLIKRLSGLANKDLAFLSVSYPLRSVRVYRKAMINNFTEFLSNIGSFLGFFLGFSLISIAEIFYFICIRPHCISRQRPRRKIKPQPKPKAITRMPRIYDPYAQYDNYIPTIYLE